MTTRAPRTGGRPAGRTGARSAAGADRLPRLLALIPYVVSRKVVGLAEAAAAFGVSEQQLIDDLNLLWCVELRDPDPYCPIDLSYEGGEIVVSEAESIARPLRLNVDEASALLVALRMLAEIPEIEGRDAVNRVLAKLEAAAGDAVAVSHQLAVHLDRSRPGTLGTVKEAVQRGRRVHLTYYVPGRDEDTERDADPMRLLFVEGRGYLEAWCRRAEAVRLFRLDRIIDIRLLDAAAEPPAEAEPRELADGLFQPSAADVVVRLELAPAGRWVADYYPCESVEELGEGRLAVSLRTPDTRWVRRLALRLGERGRVVGPPALVREIHQDARAALAGYES